MTNLLAEKQVERVANNSNITVMEQQPRGRILLVGPVGGTIGGAVALFQVFMEEMRALPDVTVDVIDTSPHANYYLYKKRLVNSETVNRATSIISQFKSKIGQADAVLFFANKDLALTVGPILFTLTKMRGKSFYMKTIAGDLAVGLGALRTPLRQYAVRLFNNFDGIFAETQLLQGELEALGCRNVHYIPNCRVMADTPPRRVYADGIAGQLRLLFLSQVNRKKGVFIILDAMRALHERGNYQITCDFYGPVFEDIEAEFLEALAETQGVRYFGPVAPAEVLETLARYDALVLPTYHSTEGHPGIIIEAMQVGLPVVSSNLRAIPELITHGANGLLIPTEDVTALADAMAALASDPVRLAQMGEASFRRRLEFSAQHVVGQAVYLLLS